MKKGILLLSTLICLLSCTQNDDITDEPPIQLEVPLIKTSSIIEITETSAVSGGIITNDGGSRIISKGICWSTSINPTLKNDFISEGVGMGDYASTLNDLEENTTYYVKAYATNSIGTGYGNEQMFNTLEKPSTIYTGDIVLSTQLEVDNFGLNNYSEIVGNLVLGYRSGHLESKIDNLESLISLTKITGNLYIYTNTLLENLDGLNNLTQIDGNLEIFNNKSLSNINGLNNLFRISGDFYLALNIALLNIDGLSNLDYIGNHIDITGNSSLVNIDSLSNITIINGLLLIDGNLSLKNVDGFSNLKSVGGLVEIKYNYELSNINGFSNLSSIDGDMSIRYNDKITDLEGLNALSFIGGSLELRNLPALKDIDALNNLSSIGDDIRIFTNHELSNIDGLSGVSSIGGSIIVLNNGSLKNLNGFSNIGSMGQYHDINIEENTNLDNLCGLQLIFENGFSNNFIVVNNQYNPSQQDIMDGNCSL